MQSGDWNHQTYEAAFSVVLHTTFQFKKAIFGITGV
jgi:hypothetical protein